MKPFDLEAAKRGDPIITRDGRKAWFVGLLPKDEYPTSQIVVAWIAGEVGPDQFCEDGSFTMTRECRNNDLFMGKRKHKSWVTIWQFGKDGTQNSKVFHTEKSAILHADEMHIEGATIIANAMPVEWEE